MVVAPPNATRRNDTSVANASGVADELDSMRSPLTQQNDVEQSLASSATENLRRRSWRLVGAATWERR
jgi:hypothetical protein